MIQETASLDAWLRAGAQVGVAVIAIFLGSWWVRRHERIRAEKLRLSQLKALKAEILYCGKLAAGYAEENISAPLYRFPRTVYDAVYPALIGSIFDENDVWALTSFYSQVDQMNRGFDNVARLYAEGHSGAADNEHRRLVAKAHEMRHPTERSRRPTHSEFFERACAAVEKHLNDGK